MGRKAHWISAGNETTATRENTDEKVPLSPAHTPKRNVEQLISDAGRDLVVDSPNLPYSLPTAQEIYLIFLFLS